MIIVAKQSFGCGRTGSWQYLRRKEIFPDLGLVFKKNKDLVLVHGKLREGESKVELAN